MNSDQLTFDGIVATEGRLPSTLHGLTSLAVDVVGQFSSPALIPASIVSAISEQTVSTFLLGLRHNRSEQMMRRVGVISSRMVKRAVDILVSDVYAEKSVTDLAAAVGVSMRALELGFRKEFGCTPHAYMQKFRLQRARDHLRAARPGDGVTVAEVAMRWGFNHTGRFAALYRRTYGIPPSQTLREQ